MKIKEDGQFYVFEDFLSYNLLLGFTKPSYYCTNPEEVAKKLGFKNFVYLNQIHSSNIHYVDKGGVYTGDGIFTEECKILLMVKTADCIPIYFLSREEGVIGIIHMGWRSAYYGILDNIKYDLSNFYVICGVGLRKCCYQVGKEFKNFFNDYILERENNLFFDPIKFIQEKLYLHNLNKERFEDINICSFCSPQKFFSFRRDKTNLRTISFIARFF